MIIKIDEQFFDEYFKFERPGRLLTPDGKANYEGDISHLPLSTPDGKANHEGDLFHPVYGELRSITFTSISTSLDPIEMPVSHTFTKRDLPVYLDTETFRVLDADTVDTLQEKIGPELERLELESYRRLGTHKEIVERMRPELEQQELESYRRLGTHKEIIESLNRLKLLEVLRKEEIELYGDFIPSEEACRKLVCSLNNDLRRLYHGPIKEDLHVSYADRLVSTLNRVMRAVEKETKYNQKLSSKIRNIEKDHQPKDGEVYARILGEILERGRFDLVQYLRLDLPDEEYLKPDSLETSKPSPAVMIKSWLNSSYAEVDKRYKQWREKSN